MFKLIKILTCSLFLMHLHSTLNATTTSITNVKNSNWQAYKKTTAQSARQLANNKTALLLNNEDALHLISERKDKMGLRHYRYQQKYKDIPIEGAIYLMHEKAGKVELSNGQLVIGLNINAKPSIDIKQAQQLAINHIGANQYASLQNKTHTKQALYKAETYNPAGSLIIVDPEFSSNPANYRLAYKFEIFAIQPLLRKDVYVDAIDGKIILELEKLYKCTHALVTAKTNYMEDDVTFDVCQQYNGTYSLEYELEYGKLSVRDYANIQLPVNDADNYFDQNLAANDVYYFTQKAFAYFEEKHGRILGENEADSITTSIVNYARNNDPNNAFYISGEGFFYGAGDGQKYSSFSSCDIVGHELMHGVTAFEADLIYKGQSGALNESFSDIFGELIEDYYKQSIGDTLGNDWIIGADYVIDPNKNGMRSLRDPKDNTMVFQLPDTYKKEYWQNSPIDNGGVHFKSGVQNYWFFLLSEGSQGSKSNDNNFEYNFTGIGKEAAAEIAYKNLTEYLTPTSQYIDARKGSIQAAINLHGENHPFVERTKAAWDAVGVYDDCRFLDSLVLHDLKVAEIKHSNWNEHPIDEWTGITFNNEGCVTALKLDSLNLTSELPSAIGELIHLKKLDLSYNNLSGILPSSLGNLTNLEELNLSDNKFKQSLPEELLYLDQLEKLNVSNNNLSGCFEYPLIKLCDQLDSISYYHTINEGNNFENKWEEFCVEGDCIPCRKTDSLTLVKIYEATLGENWTNTWNFNEPITAWHGVSLDYDECVEGLDLANNNLSGTIPTEIGDLYSLHYLYLDSNRLQGSIPYELININNIIYIDLSYNNLSGCYNANLNDLNEKWDDAFICNNKISDGNYFDASWCEFYFSKAGTCDSLFQMPCRQRDSLALLSLYNTTDGVNWQDTWNLNEPISNWQGVTLNEQGCVISLSLTNNSLSGFIPEQITHMQDLEALFLFRNSITGSIPQNIADLTKLKKLHLQSNSLEGGIPASLGNLDSLEVLFLEYNLLSGNIPKTIGNLSKLRVLHLDSNQLTGSIPVEFAELNSLSWCELQNNQLSGNIPPELGELRELTWIDIQHNLLTGNLPANFGNLNKLQVLNANNNELGGCYDPNLINLCYTLGILKMSNVGTGNQFEMAWDDFCDNEIGYCDDPVWPGDFNNDGIVNYNDLLYWGLAEGIDTGIVRSNATIEWSAQNCPEWDNFIAIDADGEAINVKHQDANGDGMVDANDLAAFKQNYGKIADDFGNFSYQNDEIQFELKLSEYSATLLKFDIILKSNIADSVDIHGFSCSLNLSDFIVDTIFLDSSNSAFPYDRSETFYDRTRGIFDMSLTKTNQQNTRIRNGSIVETMVICLPIVDLPGGDPPGIKIEGGGILDANSKYSGVWKSSIYAYDPVEFNEGGLPFNNLPMVVTAKHEHCNGLGAACVSIAEGYGTEPYTYLWSTGELGSEIENLTSGKYIVTVTDASGKTNTRAVQIDGQLPTYYSDGSTKCESDCAEYLTLPVHLTNGVYQAEKSILFNGKIHKTQSIKFIAGESIKLNSGTSIEQLSINIKNCSN